MRTAHHGETTMIDACPKCGGTATLVQSRDSFEEIPDVSNPSGKQRIRVKVEEYRCQDPSCEHEFEEVIKEPVPDAGSFL